MINPTQLTIPATDMMTAVSKTAPVRIRYVSREVFIPNEKPLVYRVNEYLNAIDKHRKKEQRND